MKRRITDAQIRAMEIMGDTSMENPIDFKHFAKQMWPDSNMHKKLSKGGDGVQKGKAAWLSAGSYLAKLRKKGFVNYSTMERGYYISSLGKEILRALQDEHEQVLLDHQETTINRLG